MGKMDSIKRIRKQLVELWPDLEGTIRRQAIIYKAVLEVMVKYGEVCEKFPLGNTIG